MSLPTATVTKSQDKELETTIQRALDLRITIREICEHTGVNHVTLWRWRREVSPRFNERQAFLEKLETLIEYQRALYLEV